MPFNTVPNRPIQYYNRYTHTLETEQIYGENFLRWAYTTKTGNVLMKFFSRSPWISKFYGYLMNQPSSKKKILPFIEKFNLDSNEFAQNPNTFTSFNDFFYRKLKPSARPIDNNPNHAVFPADGRHLAFQNISTVTQIFAKGQRFDLPTLTGSQQLANDYAEGGLLISRLCPSDYHRFHFPIENTPSPTTLINGPLNSVNPLALRRNIRILFENKRTLTTLQSETFGPILMIEVGAMCVGSIIQTFTPNQPAPKGHEKGFFQFGGSTTLLLFQKNRIQFADDLIQQSLNGIEIYAKMGDFLGSV